MPQTTDAQTSPQPVAAKSSLLPSVIGGSVAGFYAVIFMFSYASVIFSGDLVAILPNGIGALLFGATAISLVLALRSSIPGLIASPNDNPVAISAVMAAVIAQRIGTTVSSDALLSTVLVAIGLSTVLMGTAFIVLGHLKLANLVRFIPYPVIGGFLAGTGLILLRGAFVASSDVPVTFATLLDLVSFDAVKLWLPALVFGIVMLVVLHKFSHFLIVPGVVTGAIGIFYIGLLISGSSLEQAVESGWLIKTSSEGGIWSPITLGMVTTADWGAILGQMGLILTVATVGVIAVLLNTTALESAFGEDLDMNRELKSAGLANIIAGFGGSAGGYHYVGMTVLMRKMGANRRLVGAMVALVCLVALIFGPSFVALVPKYILGGLAFFIGLDFLHDWVWASSRKLNKTDMGIILVIMGVMAGVGPLQGVMCGLAVTVVLFVITYSRVSVIRHEFSGATYHSNQGRPRAHRRLLREKGEQTHILRLHGFIFFGTATGLLSRIKERATDPSKAALWNLILDFQQVDGLDSSALHSFVKIKQLADQHEFKVVFAHMPARVLSVFEGETFLDGSPMVPQCYPDLDHALEWCENQTLTAEGLEPVPRVHPLREWLESVMGGTAVVNELMGFLNEVRVGKGEHIIREGQHAEALYFVESGQLTVQLEPEGVAPIRVRTAGPGTLVGAAGVFMDAAHSNQLASVVATEPATVYRLTTTELQRMRTEAPKTALLFHEFIVQYMAERLRRTARIVESLTAYDS